MENAIFEVFASSRQMQSFIRSVFVILQLQVESTVV